MLSRLSIRDIVLIDRLDIDFADGLAVLTGETGAGKSILLDAFALALGGRGDQALVRQGVEQGQVTAVLDVARDHPARALVDAGTHRRLLDAFGGLEDQAVKVEARWEARREAHSAADIHRAEVDRAKREGDWLRHAVDELNRLAPQSGEETALAERRT